MKFYGSIAAGVCTIWLHFEPHPDQSPDPGSGHVFKIARRIALKVMDGLKGNFMNVGLIVKVIAEDSIM